MYNNEVAVKILISMGKSVEQGDGTKTDVLLDARIVSVLKKKVLVHMFL